MNTEVKLVTENDIAELSNKIKMASSKIMISSFTKIIGVALYRFRLQIDDAHSVLGNQGLACVCWRKEKEDFKIVPNIWFSPLIHTWSIKEISFVMVHEIMHVLDRHHSRMGSRDPRIWNLACDHVINRRAKQDIENGNTQLEIPSCVFLIEEWMDKDLTAEEVYDMLLDEAEKNKLIIEVDGDGESGDGEGKIRVKYKGKEYTLDPDLDQKDGEGNDSEIEGEVKDIKSIIRGALETDAFKQLGRGDKKGGITEYLESIVEIKIPWEQLLEKAIHKLIPVKSDNRSWRVINKRMRSHGFTLPYNDTDDVNESNLYIVVDNSGSISNKDLATFASIIINSSGFFNNVIVFKHDVEVQEIIEFDKGQGIEDIKEVIKGVGRGGTSHTPVFEEIENRVTTNEDTDDVGLILMLTDYDSNIEDIWDNYEWTKEIPVKIILTDPRNAFTREGVLIFLFTSKCP